MHSFTLSPSTRVNVAIILKVHFWIVVLFVEMSSRGFTMWGVTCFLLSLQQSCCSWIHVKVEKVITELCSWFPYGERSHAVIWSHCVCVVKNVICWQGQVPNPLTDTGVKWAKENKEKSWKLKRRVYSVSARTYRYLSHVLLLSKRR